jgi:aminopeptidase-like protein
MRAPSAAQTSASDAHDTGNALYALIARLYPICRSITGDGVRETLSILSEYIPLQQQNIASGEAAFDWSIPREWNIRDAYIKDANGDRVVDFQKSNLHVISYSTPIQARMSLEELKPHLHSLPGQPSAIPYRTSYYKDRWGFCLSQDQLETLRPGKYEVMIDSTLSDGSMTYGELYLPGQIDDEILISCHVCHPSLCNDNLSGIAVATFLACDLAEKHHRYSYRFLFIPGTIGSIAWLARNEEQAHRIKHGLVLTGLGDGGSITYKRSRRGNATIDRAAVKVLADCGQPHSVIEFFPFGYDERQYCSPGFNLPVGCFMRTPHGQYPQYHTSLDNLEFVTPDSLADSLEKIHQILDVIERDQTFVNTNPKCEPRLGKRNLYRTMGGQADEQLDELALLWVLNLSDGVHSLLDIAEKSKYSFAKIVAAAEALVAVDLLRRSVI